MNPALYLVENGLYSVRTDARSFYVIKLLRLGSSPRIRLYSNRFSTRPMHVDESWLFVADDDQPTLPSAPLIIVSLDLLRSWRPHFLGVGSIESANAFDPCYHRNSAVRLPPPPQIS
jgi:hypothetical protein